MLLMIFSFANLWFNGLCAYTIGTIVLFAISFVDVPINGCIFFRSMHCTVNVKNLIYPVDNAHTVNVQKVVSSRKAIEITKLKESRECTIPTKTQTKHIYGITKNTAGSGIFHILFIFVHEYEIKL